jgi:hypothetical protein
LLLDFGLVHECQSQARFARASLAHENRVSLKRLAKHVYKIRKLALAAVEDVRHRRKVIRFIRKLGNLKSW